MILVRHPSSPRPVPNSRNVLSGRRSGAGTKPSLLRISVPSARRSLSAKAATAKRVVQLSTLDASALTIPFASVTFPQMAPLVLPLEVEGRERGATVEGVDRFVAQQFLDARPA